MSPLSDREVEILHAAACGELRKITAARLFLSPHTIQSHRRRVVQKLEARGMTNAVAVAYRQGLIR